MADDKPSDPRGSLLVTTTGEIFQPVRLHYELFDLRRLLKIFNKLDCVGPDPAKQRLVWLYTGEARTLKFERSYEDIPDEWHEIALGFFYIRRSGDFIKTSEELLLDLRSFERSAAAIEFFDRRIPRTVARLAFFDVVNRVFSGEEKPPSDFDYFFEREEIRRTNPFAMIESLEKFKEKAKGKAADIEALRGAFLVEMEARMDQVHSEVERLPVSYYEDGIEALRSWFMMRQTQSLMEWNEDRKLSFREFFARMQQRTQQEE